MKTKFKSEIELAETVVDFLNNDGWEVFQEVRNHDIIARKNNLIWCIECKLNFNFKVIEQANSARCILNSIAVPEYTNSKFKEDVCKKFGIGVIYVRKDSLNNKTISMSSITPEYKRQYRQFTEDYIIPDLKPVLKTFAKAGSKGNTGYSPYKQTMIEVKELMIKEGGLVLVNDFFQKIKNKLHWRCQTDISLRNCLISSILKFENDWIIRIKINNQNYFQLINLK